MKKDNFYGALIGLAIGDALGATTEFMNKEEVTNQYGFLNEIIGDGWLMLKPGEVTDDTDMTICVAKGIIENYNNPIPEIGKYFLEWFHNEPKDIGISTKLSLSKYTNDWEEAAKQAHLSNRQSAGNGSLMRCLPIALAYLDRDKIKDLSIKQSKMTHYDDLASEACVIYNLIANDIIQGIDLQDAIKKEINSTKYEKVITQEPDVLPTGYVVNTFKWVLRVLLTTDNYSDVVEKLTNMGEDADTTAAIAGGLAGLYYGYRNIPDKYKNKILIKDEILTLSDKLFVKRAE